MITEERDKEATHNDLKRLACVILTSLGTCLFTMTSIVGFSLMNFELRSLVILFFLHCQGLESVAVFVAAVLKCQQKNRAFVKRKKMAVSYA